MGNIEKYYEKLEENDFTNEDGESLKCQGCGSKSLTYKNKVHESFGLIEYILVCGECNSWFGHWAYSSWEIS